MARWVASGAASGGGASVADPVGSGGADTGIIVDALTAAATAGRGFVQLGEGIYSVDPNEVQIPSKTTLNGLGRGTTVLSLTGNGVLVDMSGTAVGDKVEFPSLRNVSLIGNDHTGTLIRSYHVTGQRLYDVDGFGIGGAFIDLANAWDTLWDGYIFADWCGATDGSVPAIWIRNNATASGFGYAGDTGSEVTNMIKCTGMLRIEAFCQAMRIERGPSNAQNPYGIHFADIKLETHRVTDSKHFLWVDGIRDIAIDSIECAAIGFNAGSSSPIATINWGPQALSRIGQARFFSSGAYLYYGLQMYHGVGAHFLGPVLFDGTPGGGAVRWDSTSAIRTNGIVATAGSAENGTRPAAPA